jgi:HAD superfamily hydrolase (TIGR01548 family)
MTQKRLIVFDMDGVIVDVSRSYRETVRKAARLFFAGAHSQEALPDPLFTLNDLSNVKQSGGLNNDWDLTCCVIELLCSRVKHSDAKTGLDTVMDPWNRYRSILSGCDAGELASFLSMQNHPLTRLLEECGKAKNPLVRSFYGGDVGSGNIIKQIFQEIYLGRDLFRTTYGIAPKIYFESGLIENETLLLPMGFFERLAAENVLAIATGRPGNEAGHPLNRFGIKIFFVRVYTHDDCVRAEEKIFHDKGRRVSLGKPDPYMLDAVAEDTGESFDKCYYIGDMPDDMLAAKRSKFGYVGVGVTFSAENKKDLKEALAKAGADHIADDAEALTGVFENENLF